MYAIFISNKHAYGWLDLSQPHESFDLEHIVVDELPDELLNIPDGYICIYEDGIFIHEPVNMSHETSIEEQIYAENLYQTALLEMNNMIGGI